MSERTASGPRPPVGGPLLHSDSTFRAEREVPIKVLQILEAVGGGTKKHLIDLLSELDRNRFEAVVVCPSRRHPSFGDESILDELQALGVRYEIVEMQRSVHPLADLRSLLALYRIIRTQGFDIVHAHSSKAGVLGRLAARLAGVPTVVYTPHGFFFLGKQGWKRALFRGIERLIGMVTDCTIAVSPSEMDEVLVNGIAGREAVVVIENGIALETFGLNLDIAAKRAELGVPADVPVIGTASRLNPQKDPLTLLRAMAEVMAADRRVHFVWCGDGELRDESEALVDALGIRDRVIFTGFRHDVLEVIATFDIFVVSSLFEALGYAPLEAMALRKPVVATDVVGLRDVVVAEETGIIVPPLDPEAMALALTRLLGDDALAARMGDAGRRVVEERFSLRDSVHRTEQLYAQLAARNGHPAQVAPAIRERHNGHHP